MSKGIVYIMTNPCLDGWVKIGMTERDSIEERLRELNSSSAVPFSFRCYATYEVENPHDVEKKIHKMIDAYNDKLRSREDLGKGKPREREFFTMLPQAAYSVLCTVAELRNEKNKVKLYEPTNEEIQEEEIAEKKSRRPNNTFKSLGISAEEKIEFLPDNSIVAIVKDDGNKVEYQGSTYAMSSLASKLLAETQGWSGTTKVNGWCYFMKDGVALNDLRDK